MCLYGSPPGVLKPLDCVICIYAAALDPRKQKSWEGRKGWCGLEEHTRESDGDRACRGSSEAPASSNHRFSRQYGGRRTRPLRISRVALAGLSSFRKTSICPDTRSQPAAAISLAGVCIVHDDIVGRVGAYHRGIFTFERDLRTLKYPHAHVNRFCTPSFSLAHQS